MLAAHLIHARKVVEYAHAAGVAEMEPGVFLECRLLRYASQTERLLTAIALKQVLTMIECRLYLAELARIVIDKRAGYKEVFLMSETEELQLICRYVIHEELPSLRLILCREYCVEQRVVLFLSLAATETPVAADDEQYCHKTERDHDPMPAKVHEQNNHSRAYERCAGGYKPSSDDRYHTRDTEDGTLTPPGTVGKRCTHSNHECDKGCGQRQFQ